MPADTNAIGDDSTLGFAAKLPPSDLDRIALAKIIAEITANNSKYSPEQLWMAQGRQQLPPPMASNPNLVDRSHLNKSNVDLPIARALSDPSLDFPTAKAGPGSPDQALRTLNQLDRKRPFPGAKEITVEPPKTYALPKTKQAER